VRLPRRWAAAAIGALWAASPAHPLETPEPARADAARVARALVEVYPALVNLTVVDERFADGRAMRGPGAGSGVIVTAEGHVLTNFHVAGDATRVTATLTDGEVLDAEVVAHDPLTDLSVLRLKLEERASGASPLRPARFGERALEVGDPVLAMGNPLTLSSSVTLGIVSNPRRVFTDFLGNRLEDLDLGDGGPTGLFTQWIQHDALILPGNSGGPLVDLDGAVVGINELGGGGMGFAIPVAIARDVLAQALAHGRMRRSWLGFSILPVARLGRSEGALVSSVVPESPAARAGLEPGDLLLEIAGRPVAARFFPEVPELYRTIASLPIDAEVRLRVERGGTTRELVARTVEMEEARGRQGELRRIGATAQEITGPMALMRQLPPRSGLLVTSLRAGFPAASARPPIEVGDVVTAVGDREVRSLEQLAAALDAIEGTEALIALRRGEARMLSVARFSDNGSARWGGELPKAWLGVESQVVTPELARLMGAPDLRGFRLTEVYPWTEAAAAGLEVGDVITALDGEPLEAERVQDAENLRRAFESLSIGGRAELDLVRDGRPTKSSVGIEARPRSADEARSFRQRELEFGVRDVTFLDRIERHWTREQAGVIVTDVTPGGWAQMGGLEPTDLLLTVAGREIVDVASFERAIADVLAERPAVVPIFVRRGWRTHFVFLEPEWAELELPAGGSR
jgi:S1-C subfamily serine protease